MRGFCITEMLINNVIMLRKVIPGLGCGFSPTRMVHRYVKGPSPRPSGPASASARHVHGEVVTWSMWLTLKIIVFAGLPFSWP